MEFIAVKYFTTLFNTVSKGKNSYISDNNEQYGQLIENRVLWLPKRNQQN